MGLSRHQEDGAGLRNRQVAGWLDPRWGYPVGRGCMRIRGIREVGRGFLGWGVREERTGDMGSRDTRGGSQQGRGDSGQQGPVF